MQEDPTVRRRIDREAMNERDAEVWRRRQAGETFGNIARALGMARSSVQRCLARAQKRMVAELNDELDDEVLTGSLPPDVDLSNRHNIAVLRDYARDPDNPLYRYRMGYLKRVPRAEEW